MEKLKKTIVIGASPNNPTAYSSLAIRKLKQNNYPVIPIGIKNGEIDGEPIQIGFPKIEDVHTISLYINKTHQPQYYDYILELKPKRIIFNPGAENQELSTLASDNRIETVNACTLVMLSFKQF